MANGKRFKNTIFDPENTVDVNLKFDPRVFGAVIKAEDGTEQEFHNRKRGTDRGL